MSRAYIANLKYLQMFWNLWCERVEFLNPEDPGSSHSETSVATSSTNSTIYLLSSKQYKNSTGKHQIWCNFGAGDNVSMVFKKKKMNIVLFFNYFHQTYEGCVVDFLLLLLLSLPAR